MTSLLREWTSTERVMTVTPSIRKSAGLLFPASKEEEDSLLEFPKLVTPVGFATGRLITLMTASLST